MMSEERSESEGKSGERKPEMSSSCSEEIPRRAIFICRHSA